MNYTLKTIASILGVKAASNLERPVRWLLTDSRSLSSPDDSLFFALVTPRGDGHSYIPQLYQRGVRQFVVSQMPKGDFPEAVFLQVDDTLVALQKIAAEHRSSFSVPVIGIAGSNGKTMVKE